MPIFALYLHLDIFPVLFESAFFRSPFESGPLLPPGPFGELRLEEEGRGESGRETCPRRHNHTTQPTQPHAQPTLYKKKLHNPLYRKYPTHPTQPTQLNYATQNATKRNPHNRNPQQRQTKKNTNPQAHHTIRKNTTQTKKNDQQEEDTTHNPEPKTYKAKAPKESQYKPV